MNNNDDTESTKTYHIDIPDNLIKEWQSIVDLIARIARVRAALIMRVQNGEIEVFIASNTKNNPYKFGKQGKSHRLGTLLRNSYLKKVKCC